MLRHIRLSEYDENKKKRNEGIHLWSTKHDVRAFNGFLFLCYGFRSFDRTNNDICLLKNVNNTLAACMHSVSFIYYLI